MPTRMRDAYRTHALAVIAGLMGLSVSGCDGGTSGPSSDAGPPPTDSAASGPDTGTSDAGTSDADAGAAADASRVTYVGDVQPILRTHCGKCHGAGAPYPFAESYSEMKRPSERCSGEVVGTCVGLAVANQIVEGSGCRTVVVKPFHREAWPCLDAGERSMIAAWVAGGMGER